MTAAATTTSFIAKWQQRWPEWNIAQVFVPAAQRATAFAWFALLQEFTDAAWAGADATPGLAKLAWWNEELQGWAKGARRHPLGEVLQPQPAPWRGLAASLRALPAARGSDAHGLAAGADLHAIASVLAQCEAQLFDGGHDPPAQDTDACADAIATDLRIEQQLLHGDTPAAIALRDTIDGQPSRGPRPRRLHSVLLRQRLRELATDRGPRAVSPWRSLWLAWQAARS